MAEMMPIPPAFATALANLAPEIRIPMELVEQHAYHSYDGFLKDREIELKDQPAPPVAIDYYRDGDLYMFDEFQTGVRAESRRPTIDNLYDVFLNIRDDEQEHVKTMVWVLRQTDLSWDSISYPDLDPKKNNRPKRAGFECWACISARALNSSIFPKKLLSKLRSSLFDQIDRDDPISRSTGELFDSLARLRADEKRNILKFAPCFGSPAQIAGKI